jgi:hypothetical protein
MQKQKNDGAPKKKKEVPPVRSVPELEPMEVEEPIAELNVPAVAATTPKKRTKKTSYKNLMAGVMKASDTCAVEKEKEKISKVTGGGTFSKIDKI